MFVLLWQLPTSNVVELQRTFGLRSTAVRAAWRAVAEGGMGAVTGHPRELLRLGVLPFVGYAFLHASVIAVLVDVFFLMAFGREIEGRSGMLVLGVLWVAGAVACAIAHVLWSPRSTTPAVGAAGAISAIIGASVVRDARSSVLMAVPVVIVPVVLRLPVLVVVAAWFVLQAEPLQQLLAVGSCRPVAWPGVVAGFAAGVVLSPLCRRRQRAADSDCKTTRTDSKPTRRPSSSRGR